MVESTWSDRELPILEAVFHAQEAGEDVDQAARAAVPDLHDQIYMGTIDSLHDAGYLQASSSFSGVHVDRLLPPGRRAIKQWPTGDALEAILEAVERHLAATEDPEEKSRLRRLRDFLAEEGARGVIGAVIGEAVRHVAGAG